MALSSGEVLIAGGLTDNNAVLATAELYSPTSGTSRPIASLGRPRANTPALLLRDGTVLVVGGDFPSPNLLERYLPAEDRWIPAGTLPVPRDMNHLTLTELNDGRVLITQGIYDRNIQRFRTDPVLWDPKTHAITPTAPFPRDLIGASTTLLLDGRVLLTGGVSEGGPMSPSAEAFLYSSERDEWIQTSRMRQPRAHHTATLLEDGRVLIAGGAIAADNTMGNTSEVYDPLTGTFQQTGRSDSTHTAHTATRLPSGEVLVTGGAFQGANAELFQPWTGRWTPARPSLVNRYEARAIVLPDGDVLLVGGTNGSIEPSVVENSVAEIERFSCAP